MQIFTHVQIIAILAWYENGCLAAPEMFKRHRLDDFFRFKFSSRTSKHREKQSRKLSPCQVYIIYSLPRTNSNFKFEFDLETIKPKGIGPPAELWAMACVVVEMHTRKTFCVRAAFFAT